MDPYTIDTTGRAWVITILITLYQNLLCYKYNYSCFTHTYSETTGNVLSLSIVPNLLHKGKKNGAMNMITMR